MAKLIYMRIEEFIDTTAGKHEKEYTKYGLVLARPTKNDVVLLNIHKDASDNDPVELTYLNSIGLGPKKSNILFVEFNEAKNWEWNVRKNKTVLSKLSRIKFSSLATLSGVSTICHNLGHELQIPMETAPPSITKWAYDKQTLQYLNTKYRYGPKGFAAKNNDEMMLYWYALSQTSEFSGRAVVRIPNSALSVTTTVISSESELVKFLKTVALEKLGGGVIEEWLASEDDSPSINYYVSQDGIITELFISDQFFADDTDEHSRAPKGNCYPSNYADDIQDEIRGKTRTYLNDLIVEGYWGPIGFDTIIPLNPYNGHRILITDINPRLNLPFFAFTAMKFLKAKAFCIKEEVVKKKVVLRDILKELKSELYNHETKEGFVPFNVLPEEYMRITYSKKRESILKTEERINSHLSKLR